MDLMIVGLRLAPNCPAYYELVSSRGKFRGLWHEGIEGVSGIKILGVERWFSHPSVWLLQSN